jgi:glycosyltransferase involved in cell wall biosynthesis
VIWHVRDILPNGLGKFLLQQFARWVPAKIICVSEEVAKQFKQSHKKVRVVYNGIDFELIQKQSRPLPKLSFSRNPVISCVGQIAHWKGQDIFVEALKILKDRGVPLTALLVGSVLAPEREASFARTLKNKVKTLGLQKDVQWVGYQDPVYPWMAVSNLMVHCNRTPEPFGRVLVEALGLGVPVLSNTCAAYRELLPRIFWKSLPRPSDALDLANHIQEYLDRSKKTKAMTMAGKKFVQQKFSLEKTLSGVATVYQNL